MFLIAVFYYCIMMIYMYDFWFQAFDWNSYYSVGKRHQEFYLMVIVRACGPLVGFYANEESSKLMSWNVYCA